MQNDEPKKTLEMGLGEILEVWRCLYTPIAVGVCPRTVLGAAAALP